MGHEGTATSHQLEAPQSHETASAVAADAIVLSQAFKQTSIEKPIPSCPRHSPSYARLRGCLSFRNLSSWWLSWPLNGRCRCPYLSRAWPATWFYSSSFVVRSLATIEGGWRSFAESVLAKQSQSSGVAMTSLRSMHGSIVGDPYRCFRQAAFPIARWLSSMLLSASASSANRMKRVPNTPECSMSFPGARSLNPRFEC